EQPFDHLPLALGDRAVPAVTAVPAAGPALPRLLLFLLQARRVTAAEARHVGAVEALGLLVPQRPPDRVHPDRAGQRGALHRAVVPPADLHVRQRMPVGAADVADADRGGELRRVPGEPGRGVAVGGAGLARGGPARTLAAHRALVEDAGPHVADRVGGGLLQRPAAVRLHAGALVVPVDDLHDGERPAVLAAGRERGERGGHRERVHLVDAEGERRHLAQRLAVGPADAELPGGLDHVAEADLALQHHVEDVDRLPGAGLQAVRAALALAA